MRLVVVPVIAFLLGTLSAAAAETSVAEALAARNPALLELRSADPAAFETAVDILAEAQAKAGVDTLKGAPPPPAPVGRGIGVETGKELTAANPDLLWLYNAAPEGMQDLVSLLKSAGKKGKS